MPKKRSAADEIAAANIEIGRAVQIFEQLRKASLVSKATHAEALGLQTIRAMGAMMAAMQAIEGSHVKQEAANDE